MLLLIVLCLTPILGASASQLPRPEEIVTASNISTNGTSTLQRSPYVVQVDRYHSYQWGVWSQLCAGTVLTSMSVLTAASCVWDHGHLRRIRAGANYRNTGGAIRQIEILFRISMNPDEGGANELVVLRLRSPMTFSDVIQQGPIVASNATIPAGLVLDQLGWGSSNNSFVGLSSDRVTIIKYEWSNQTLPANATAPPRNVLTAAPSHGALVNGDIGSPWVYGNITIGILTGSIPAGNGSWSDSLIAASVTAYTSWIIRVA